MVFASSGLGIRVGVSIGIQSVSLRCEDMRQISCFTITELNRGADKLVEKTRQDQELEL